MGQRHKCEERGSEGEGWEARNVGNGLYKLLSLKIDALNKYKLENIFTLG